jgi:hypothetical protein
MNYELLIPSQNIQQPQGWDRAIDLHSRSKVKMNLPKPT